MPKNDRRYHIMYILYIFYSAFLPVTGFHLYCVGCPSTGIFPSQPGMDSCLCTFRHRLRRGGMLICAKSFRSRQAQTRLPKQRFFSVKYRIPNYLLLITTACTPWKHSMRTELHSGIDTRLNTEQHPQLSQMIIFITLKRYCDEKIKG